MMFILNINIIGIKVYFKEIKPWNNVVRLLVILTILTQTWQLPTSTLDPSNKNGVTKNVMSIIEEKEGVLQDAEVQNGTYGISTSTTTTTSTEPTLTSATLVETNTDINAPPSVGTTMPISKTIVSKPVSVVDKFNSSTTALSITSGSSTTAQTKTDMPVPVISPVVTQMNTVFYSSTHPTAFVNSSNNITVLDDVVSKHNSTIRPSMDQDSQSSSHIIIIIVVALIVLALAIYGGYRLYRKEQVRRLRLQLMPVYNFDPTESDDWESNLLEEEFSLKHKDKVTTPNARSEATAIMPGPARQRSNVPVTHL